MEMEYVLWGCCFSVVKSGVDFMSLPSHGLAMPPAGCTQGGYPPFSFRYLSVSGAHRRQTISPEMPGPSLVTPAAPLSWPDPRGAEALLQHLPRHCLAAPGLSRSRRRDESGGEDSELLEPHHGTQAQLRGSKTQQWQAVHIPEAGAPAVEGGTTSGEEGHPNGGHCTW